MDTKATLFFIYTGFILVLGPQHYGWHGVSKKLVRQLKNKQKEKHEQIYLKKQNSKITSRASQPA